MEQYANSVPLSSYKEVYNVKTVACTHTTHNFYNSYLCN